jgi:hypothetical protein
MFQNKDKRGLKEKEALAGEIQEEETSGEFGSSTMGCIVWDVDVLGFHSSAHLCRVYEAYGRATSLEREAKPS